MVAGIEAEIFRPDDELRRLARCAVELGVEKHFGKQLSPGALIETLRTDGEIRNAPGSRSWRCRGIPGSSSLWALGFTTFTWPGMMSCRCRSRAFRTTSNASRPGSHCTGPLKSCWPSASKLIEDYRELLTSRTTTAPPTTR